MTGYVLDAGALIAYEKRSRLVSLIVRRARDKGESLPIPAGVVAQVWRGGPRQAVLAQLLSSDTVEVVPLDDIEARAAGQLCGATGTSDVVDASVVICAQRRKASVVTSGPRDLRRLDPSLPVVIV